MDQQITVLRRIQHLWVQTPQGMPHIRRVTDRVALGFKPIHKDPPGMKAAVRCHQGILANYHRLLVASLLDNQVRLQLAVAKGGIRLRELPRHDRFQALPHLFLPDYHDPVAPLLVHVKKGKTLNVVPVGVRDEQRHHYPVARLPQERVAQAPNPCARVQHDDLPVPRAHLNAGCIAPDLDCLWPWGRHSTAHPPEAHLHHVGCFPCSIATANSDRSCTFSRAYPA